MVAMEMSESDYDESDLELQEDFEKGLLKPGLNKVETKPKTAANNVSGMARKLQEFKLDLPWIETLDSIDKQAPLAPELVSKMLEQENKLENLKRNNKKLIHLSVDKDPILNDFKREMSFYRQAQATVLAAIPKLKHLGIDTKRPDEYFAEMAKTDIHMQKVRENLMKKQSQQQQIEKVKQLRTQRKEGKALQIQTQLKRQQEKKQMLNQIKNVRKGVSNNLDFLNDKKKEKSGSKKSLQKRKWRDDKFGYGGKKKGSKLNTRESAADYGEHGKSNKGISGKSNKGKGGKLNKRTTQNKGSKFARPGKNKRIKIKNRK